MISLVSTVSVRGDVGVTVGPCSSRFRTENRCFGSHRCITRWKSGRSRSSCPWAKTERQRRMNSPRIVLGCLWSESFGSWIHYTCCLGQLLLAIRRSGLKSVVSTLQSCGKTKSRSQHCKMDIHFRTCFWKFLPWNKNWGSLCWCCLMSWILRHVAWSLAAKTGGLCCFRVIDLCDMLLNVV